MSDAALMRMMTQDGPGEAEVGHLEKLEADAIVIAGGAWSRNVLRLLGPQGLQRAYQAANQPG